MSDKTIVAVVAVFCIGLLLYVADAIYPTWSWSCRALNTGFGYSSVEKIPETADDPQLGGPSRHFKLTLPEGCEAKSGNTVRNVVDWYFLPPKRH